MAIPRDAPHPNAAHAFIDYMLNRTVGAQNANFTFYATPNEAAKADVQDEILSDPAIYPSRDVQEKLEFIQDIGDALSHYQAGWETIQNT